MAKDAALAMDQDALNAFLAKAFPQVKDDFWVEAVAPYEIS